MAIKTTIQALISSLIRTNPALIDKTEHADVEDALLANAYGDRVTEKDSDVTKVITSNNSINTALQYRLTFVKQGRFVNVQGFLTNTSALIVSDADADNYFFEIVGAEYLPAVVATYKFPNGNELIKIDSNKVYYSAIGAGVTKNISFTYNELIMATGILVNDFRPEYSENLLPEMAGTVVRQYGGNLVVDYDTNRVFEGDKSIKVTFVTPFGDVDRAAFKINDYNTTIKKSGSHILSYRFYRDDNDISDVETYFFVKVFVNDILYSFNTFENDLRTDNGFDTSGWNTYAQNINVTEGDVILLQFEAYSNGNSTILYFDGLKLEYDDRFLGTPSIYSKPLVDIDTIPSSFVFVSSLADLPTPITGTITLLANYTYYITTEIDLLGNRLVGSANTTIIGASSENSILKSTGLGVGVPLLSSIYTTPIRHICIKDVDTAIDFDGTTNPNDMALDFTGVNFVNVPNIGIVKDASNFIFDKGAFVNSKGLSFDGTIGTVGFGNCLFSGDGLAGNLLELLSTCVITRRFRVIYSSIVAFGSTTGINVNVSATVPIESYILDTINFSGGGSYLGGVMVNDNKTNFLNCKGIQNSAEISQYFMHANTTTTVVVSTGVAYKALGTTTSSAMTQKFTNTNNRATYVGSIARNFLITASLSAESGNNNQIGVYIAKNGTLINESVVYGTTSGTGRGENIVAQTLVELSENDYIEIFVENESSTASILVTDLNLIIQ